MADKNLAEGKVLVDLGGGVFAEKVVAVNLAGTDISGGGGGGGAATIADGADINAGALADAAATAGGTGSLSAKLRAISRDTGALTETAPASDTASSGLNGRLQRIAQRLTSLIALLPAALGQGTMAQSLRVVLASDQSALAVTSTPLAGGATTAASTQTITTGGTAQNAFAANASRRKLIVQNLETEVMYVNVTGTASAGVGSLALKGCTVALDGTGGAYAAESGSIDPGAVSVIAATTGHRFTAWQA